MGGNKAHPPFCDPFIRIPSGDPYEALAPFGMKFGSSMDDVHKCALQVQKQRAGSSARDQAYRQLRTAEDRLLVDFFYYQPDPAVFEPHKQTTTSPRKSVVASEEETPAGLERLMWPLLHELWGALEDDTAVFSLPQSGLEGEE